ncbi:MAG: site-2 protease family protein [Christensenellales bacterium]|jgi:Zn-dependent protease
MLFNSLSGGFDLSQFLTDVLYLLPALLIGLSFHEFAHAWMAVKMGDDTPRFMGRLTIDPLKHIDPIGALMLLVAGFGWAKPVIVNPRNYRNYRKGQILVSIAGVTMNFVLAFLFTAAYAFMVYLNIQSMVAYRIISNIIVVNIVLMVFNLLPVPPLDGYNLLRGFASHRMYGFFSFCDRYGTWILILFLISGVGRSIISTVTGGILSLLLSLFGL